MQAKYEPSIIRKLDQLLHDNIVLKWIASKIIDFDELVHYWELGYATNPINQNWHFILCTFDTLDELKVWCDLHGLDSNKLDIRD